MIKLTKDLIVRSSTEEFITFKLQEKDKGIQVRYENETLWMTQKAMSELFNVEQPAIAKHLINIYNEKELDKDSTYSKMELVQKEGHRSVKRNVEFYNLDAIISVGYRVNSLRATQFRRWATNILKTFTIQGYVLDKERMKNGSFIDKDYFEKLLEEIREIRLSERRFYQKVTDIYATSIDYDPRASVSQEFFKKVQNKIHYAIHGHTAAELIVERADAEKDFMGLLTFKGTQPTLVEAKTAKNYLDEKELRAMGQLVSGYLDFAERQAEREQPMTMNDWAEYLDRILTMSGEQLLQGSGNVSHAETMEHATNEYRKYKQRTISDVEQDYLDSIKAIDNLSKKGKRD